MVQKITPEQTQTWLREMGCSPRLLPASDPGTRFQIEHDYPPGTPHRLNTFAPTAQPRALVVMAVVAVSADHIARFQDLEQDEKAAFLQDLTTTLNRDFVEFSFPPQGTNVLSCPPMFQVIATRYDDGLSLD